MGANGADNTFNQNYFALWGLNHFTLLNQGSEVQLLLDKSSGLSLSLTLIHARTRMCAIRIQVQVGLTSAPDFKDQKLHDEIDFEFLGTNGTLQTNVFANDDGHREQKFQLWFDPTKDFHTYEILWNQYQIVFFVDKIPIRVFKNNTALGVNYPSNPMQIEASIWKADWAGQVNWSQAPFIAHYQYFNIDGCPTQQKSISQQCYSLQYEWNKREHWELSPVQKQQYEQVRKAHLVYDYCSDKSKNHPECPSNK
ncbi:unnamed protein product [Ilex paraguariensis]|uniref:Xyloglucan endotransglucosylase/hydrolase n=1 Tax=Ilex paraguariensis TaxID=185542 RepID=A0ABC8T2I7_9AQUA